MRILQVIHGYPMRYNAGSEVYTQMLCHELAQRHAVHVFCRQENAFIPDFQLTTEVDQDDPRVTLHLVNNPRFKDRYRATAIDQCLVRVLQQVCPDVVHIQHLNHLSTSLVAEVAQRGIPILYTLHDYWLMCPRGQFIQMFPENPDSIWSLCQGQNDEQCAQRCYARYFSGADEEQAAEIRFWSQWVKQRMQHLRAMSELVDLFVAPSRYLQQRYHEEFGLPAGKLVYLDYGFALERLQGRTRQTGEPFTFGYIGTHIPAKGIHDLLQAFGRISPQARLRIWGRPRGQHTANLKALTQALPEGAGQRVEWLPEYRNQNIVTDVFNRVDAIVVPSLWVENAPLVIHEAQQARVPVITAAMGGMAEYVHHEVNGLLFHPRSPQSLAEQMQRLYLDPALATRLGNRGYIFSANGDVPSIQEHARHIEALYELILQRRDSARVAVAPGPWRITFDTNPDSCNLHCIMCEEHSPYKPPTSSPPRPKRIMPLALIRRVVSSGVRQGLREIIPSTMGEPLLYKDFEGIVAICKKYGVKLNLTTNGTFPRLGAQAWAQLLVPVTSDVKISWNGATKATQEAIMRGSHWEQALANVRTFVAVRDQHAAAGGNRCRVTFQLTFMQSNVDELVDIVRLAIELGIDRVKGHHLWTHFEELQALSMRRSREAIRHWNATVEAVHALANRSKLPNGQHIILENIFPLHENATADLAPGGPCPFLGQEAWINTAGRFDVCCAPDALRRSFGDFGNLGQQDLMTIWHGDTYKHFVHTYRNRSVCLGCNMRRPLPLKLPTNYLLRIDCCNKVNL